MSTPILSAFYFGSVEHYRVLAQYPKVIIDIGEHYERQSYRTRTSIVGPNGVQHLNVQIVRDHGNKMPMRNVGLGYVERWPQQHLHAIRSAYGNTPWFIHYIDALEHLLLQPHERLVDLNLATVRMCMKWLALDTEVEVSDEYLEVASDEWRVANVTDATRHSSLATRHLDLRTTFHPKRPLPPEIPATPPYHQIFADRHGFLPRMSVLDLVMNTGPQARSFLQ
ncbi:MAG: WbqC family protein [Flavobacteriales bacterium]|nr:WbqC family protein [Flavobacteriales bacterium]